MGISDKIRIYLQPQNKNQVTIRLTNLDENKTLCLDLDSTVRAYWKEANKLNQVNAT